MNAIEVRLGSDGHRRSRPPGRVNCGLDGGKLLKGAVGGTPPTWTSTGGQLFHSGCAVDVTNFVVSSCRPDGLKRKQRQMDPRPRPRLGGENWKKLANLCGERLDVCVYVTTRHIFSTYRVLALNRSTRFEPYGLVWLKIEFRRNEPVVLCRGCLLLNKKTRFSFYFFAFQT